jgi:hypothetical protein
MPTYTSDENIQRNLTWLLKIHEDVWCEMQNKLYPKAAHNNQLHEELKAVQYELLLKLLIAHVRCEGLGSRP